jgi:hypothetical protein
LLPALVPVAAVVASHQLTGVTILNKKLLLAKQYKCATQQWPIAAPLLDQKKSKKNNAIIFFKWVSQQVF